ncbi:MAG: hypothetical protein IAA31_08595 [Candidatus Anaerobiospirillum merdipullorum]|uniref:Lipoprotein n=1 Tax=Candidatus Anaerobiospirillum merdipullorum TaxID=2838450 RepID=A0A9E2NT16_9GAMM|nr:hypothetical protein [Candidatus Anaerobiospirillum merdipullorum]
MRYASLSAAMLAALLACSGCASNSAGQGGSNYSYDGVDPTLTQDDANFFSESGWTACAIGAGVGAGLCLLLGHDADARLRCVAMAVPAGCGIFMGGNYLLDELRVNYKTKEAQLDHMTQLVEQDNRKLTNLNDQMQKLLDKDKQELSRLERGLADGSVQYDTLQQKLGQMDKNIDYMQRSIKVAQDRLDDYKQVRQALLQDGSTRMTAAGQQQLKELNTAIADMEAAIDLAMQNQLAYAQERSSLQAGTAA